MKSSKTLLITTGTQALFIVNSVELHLAAFINGKSVEIDYKLHSWMT